MLYDSQLGIDSYILSNFFSKLKLSISLHKNLDIYLHSETIVS